MSATTVSYRTPLAVSAAEAFRRHARPGALERLAPPWEPVQVLERTGNGISDGARVTLGIRVGLLRWRWVSEHRGYRQDEQFCDVQIAGPFARWEHTHRFVPDGAAACDLEDRITDALPLGLVAQRWAGALVRRKLDRLFTYRHHIAQHDLAAHAAYVEPRRLIDTGYVWRYPDLDGALRHGLGKPHAA
jgi:ligand-binding SRPBCC domain-containing protein